MGMCTDAMQYSSRIAGTTPAWHEPRHLPQTVKACAALALALGCLAAGCVLLSLGDPVAAAGTIAAGTAISVAWSWPVPGRPRPVRAVPQLAKRRPHPGDTDLYLDLDAVEIEAVYVLGNELLTHLKGGVGHRTDPVTGEERQIETSEVCLTWRCHGHRSAEKLASQLNRWEALRTPLRLLAASGRCALLMEDDSNWVVLPELRIAA